MKNKEAPGMSLIVKSVTRLTAGLILIYGIYIVFRGHIGPGGGFAGGVIIALSLVHLMLAFGKDVVLKRLDEARGIIISSLGALAFLILGIVGFLGFKAPFLKERFEHFSAGLIPIYDVVIGVLVSSGLFITFLALVLLTGKREKK
ncbi:MAG: hypothetical protein HY761_06205 [Candidatus Omnitrophica bacterium]|nr:hypothetical protein [Candidatus Omnitrophota bacterium]